MVIGKVIYFMLGPNSASWLKTLKAVLPTAAMSDAWD